LLFDLWRQGQARHKILFNLAQRERYAPFSGAPVLIAGSSCKITFKSELLTRKSPLYRQI